MKHTVAVLAFEVYEKGEVVHQIPYSLIRSHSIDTVLGIQPHVIRLGLDTDSFGSEPIESYYQHEGDAKRAWAELLKHSNCNEGG